MVLLGVARVLNISDITVVSIDGIGHSLGATVGKEDVVLASDGSTVGILASSKVDSSIVINNIVSVVVVSRSVVFGLVVGGGGFVRRGGFVRGGGFVGGSGPVSVVGNSDGQNGEKSDENL